MSMAHTTAFAREPLGLIDFAFWILVEGLANEKPDTIIEHALNTNWSRDDIARLFDEALKLAQSLYHDLVRRNAKIVYDAPQTLQ